MSMKTIYCKGTKKEANEALKNKKQITGTIFGGLSDDEEVILNEYKENAVIKFYTKLSPDGIPIAKSYGQLKNGRII